MQREETTPKRTTGPEGESLQPRVESERSVTSGVDALDRAADGTRYGRLRRISGSNGAERVLQKVLRDGIGKYLSRDLTLVWQEDRPLEVAQ